MKFNIFRLGALSALFFMLNINASVPQIHNDKSPKRPKKENGLVLKNNNPIVILDNDEIKVNLPSINREFRGVWIASVANINWPSKNNLSVDQQKAEAIRMLDMLKDHNFNAVIFQVRPSSDALYTSSLEPWSYFLTGETGKAPFPNYDPLQFWVEEAHKRGIELHAWLNPYRAHHSNGGSVTSQSMVNKLSDMTVRLKNGMYWFDPANPRTQDHVSNIVKDLVKRYDIDAIHFDDYFYPYATYNGGKDFPDTVTWSDYKKNGGSLSLADWRRDNVNKFVERIYKEIHAEKSYVKFGISPFGIWKPGYPEGIIGSSQYDELYADAKLWLNKGWVDYFSPQLYWPVDSKNQGFEKLLTWWQSENTLNRHLWPGLNTIEVKAIDRPTEIKKEIEISRNVLNNSTGAVHWSIAGLTKNSSMLPMLKNGPYKEQALVPKSPWLKSVSLDKPSLYLNDEGTTIHLNWSSKNIANVFQWVLYTQYNGVWETEILTQETLSKSLLKSKDGKALNAVALKSVDRLSNESDYTAKKIK